MEDIGWVVLIVGAVAFAGKQWRSWYRRRVAARLADTMLSDVLKGKDAFRR